MISADKINDGFKGAIHCSQQVAEYYAEKLGFDRETAMRLTAPFGAGMFIGEVCGAVCGAMVVIGMKYGHCKHGDAEGNAAMMAKVAEFNKEFISRNGTVVCRDLVGQDFSQPGELEKAFANGRIFEFCPKMVQDTIDILEKIL